MVTVLVTITGAIRIRESCLTLTVPAHFLDNVSISPLWSRVPCLIVAQDGRDVPSVHLPGNLLFAAEEMCVNKESKSIFLTVTRTVSFNAPGNQADTRNIIAIAAVRATVLRHNWVEKMSDCFTIVRAKRKKEKHTKFAVYIFLEWISTWFSFNTAAHDLSVELPANDYLETINLLTIKLKWWNDCGMTRSRDRRQIRKLLERKLGSLWRIRKFMKRKNWNRFIYLRRSKEKFEAGENIKIFSFLCVVFSFDIFRVLRFIHLPIFDHDYISR